MFKNPLYPSQDGLYHIARISEFDASITNWQIPPRLAPNIENQIGYPLFIANYQLPYYLAEVFTLPTQNSAFAFKAVMSVTFILSAVFAFLLFKNVGSNLASLTGAIFYTYLPYRFANLYDRGSFGESVALMFVPLVLLGLYQVKKNSKHSFILLSVSIFGLITSHTVIFILFAPFFLLYFLLIIKPDTSILKKTIVAVLFAIALSAFQLIPAVFEKRYLTFDQTLLSLYLGHFTNIFQILRIPHPAVNLGTPFQIGASATLVIVLSTIIRSKKNKFEVNFMLAAAIVGLLLSLPISKLLWQNLPVIKYILYPWRFISLTVLASSFLAVFLVDNIRYKKTAAFTLIALTIFVSRHYFLKPIQLVTNPPTANLTTQNENDTIWSNNNTFTQKPLVSSNPNSNIYITRQKPFNVSANIINAQESTITIRKMYFPGWILKVNGQKTAITIENGLITTKLQPGSWHIETYFTESLLRIFSDLLTLFGFIILLALLLKPKLAAKI